MPYTISYETLHCQKFSYLVRTNFDTNKEFYFPKKIQMLYMLLAGN